MTRGAIIFWSVIIGGYVWTVVEYCAGHPFDAFVLFLVTFSFHTFRNAVVEDAD